MPKNQIEDSLWQRCFWEEFQAAKEAGEENVVFDNVDKLVLKKSQMGIIELIQYLEDGS